MFPVSCQLPILHRAVCVWPKAGSRLMHICELVFLSLGGTVAPVLAGTLMLQTREQLAFLVEPPAAASGAKSPGAPRPGGDMGGA